MHETARWLYQVVTRKCADWVRSQQRQRQLNERMAQKQKLDPPAESDSLADDVTRVRVALHQMPSDRRALLAMSYLDGLSVAEIAQTLDIPAGTVRSRLYHARQEQVIATFRGQSRWLVVMTFIMTTVFVILAAVTVFQFFRANNLREMIAWACGFGFSLLSIAMFKIWYWMELNKNTVTREIKRVELQVARLAGLTRKPDDPGGH